MDLFELGYLGLFVGCFLAATIVPFASEGVVAFYILNNYDPALVLLIATAGNSLGSYLNYAIGMISSPDKIQLRMKKPDQFKRFSEKIKRYGVWLAALSWVPIIGDPLTIVMGFFRVRFIPFMLLVFLTKGIRYYIIIFLLT